MSNYLKTIFREYNSFSDEGQYFIDKDGKIYFSLNGQVNCIGKVSYIKYITVVDFDHNISIQGKLITDNDIKTGKYLLTPNSPKLITEYINDNKRNDVV